MSISSFLFQAEEAVNNIRRNGLMSLAALSTVTMAMVVLGGALLTIYRLGQFADTQPRQFEMELFMNADTPRSKVEEIQKHIEKIPGVEYVHLFSKEQAWKEMEDKDHRRGSTISDALSESNPLPDRLDVKLIDPRDTNQISARLQDGKLFPQIHKVQDAHEELDKLLAFSRMVRNIGAIASLGLFIATSLVIQNTIKLTVAARRREIRIMQLVGATPGFIRLPMVLEGAFYGVAGSLIASFIIGIVAIQITQYIGTLASPLTRTLPPIAHPLILIFWLCVIGLIVGLTGSYMSIRKFLRKV